MIQCASPKRKSAASDRCSRRSAKQQIETFKRHAESSLLSSRWLTTDSRIAGWR